MALAMPAEAAQSVTLLPSPRLSRSMRNGGMTGFLAITRCPALNTLIASFFPVHVLHERVACTGREEQKRHKYSCQPAEKVLGILENVEHGMIRPRCIGWENNFTDVFGPTHVPSTPYAHRAAPERGWFAVAPDAVGVALSVVYEEKYVGIPGYK